MKTRVGDKVRLKAGSLKGQRGVISGTSGGVITVLVTDSNMSTEVRPEEITNFSLAARRAWRSAPERRVGRPPREGESSRVSVTIRVDRDLWEDFQALEADGHIEDRTAVLNEWIRKGVGAIRKGGRTPPGA